MRQIRMGATLAAALLVTLIACEGRDPAEKTENGGAAAKTNLPEGSYAGPVLEAIHTGGYTYVRVGAEKDTIWAAAPEFAVEVGTEVVVPPGMPMENHHSRTLDRTFDLVYFVNEIRLAGDVAPSGQAGMPPGHTSPTGGGTPGGPSETPGTVDLAGIAKADGGVTVAEVYTNPSGLAGKEVRIRGKVVKFTSNIMGTNWVHLRDGTGAEGTNDLTVTTTASPKVGDTILVRGELTVDRDFGYGYYYAVIIENGQVTVE